MRMQRIGVCFFLLACWAHLPLSAHAAIQFSVQVDTSSLVGQVNQLGPFYVEFQLNDGSGTNDANNTAVITNFAFGGGGPNGSPSMTGGASGNLTFGVTLTDSSFFNQFYEGFTPGTLLSFDVSLPTNVDGGGTPDQFSFAILYTDSNFGPIELPTLDPYGTNVLVSSDLLSSNPTVNSYSSDSEQLPDVVMPAPDVQFQAASVPEPSSMELFASLLVAGHLVARRRRAKTE